MEKLNQTVIYGSESKQLECEIIREHLIPQWDKKEYDSFRLCIDDALKNYKMSDVQDNPEVEHIIFKPPKKPFEDLDNPIREILIIEQKVDKDLNVQEVIQKYSIKVGSRFYCSVEKSKCTIVGFEPFDDSSDDELNIIVDYDGGEKGTSFVDELSPI